MTVNELSRCLLSCAKQNEFPEILDSMLTYFDESPLTKECEQLNIKNIQPVALLGSAVQDGWEGDE